MPLSKLFRDRIHYFEDLPFEEAYALFDAPISSYEPGPLDIADLKVPTPAGSVPVRIYRPEASDDALPIVMWMHGGGFQKGTYLMNEGDVVARELAARGNLMLVNVEYRLVDETVKFPAPQEDCMAVLGWLVDNAERLRGRRDAIFVGGVSAGGCLAASVAVLDRDNGNNFVAGQLLNCPILHKAVPEPGEGLAQKMTELPAQLAFPPQLIKALNEFALQTGDMNDADDSWWPGEVKNLSSLPPAQIINCEYDTLRASGERYGAQLTAAGVRTEVITQAGVPHAHLNRLPEDCPEVLETLNSIIDFINRVEKKK